eukprot:8999538-Pyramimonas_sp.AAC.1
MVQWLNKGLLTSVWSPNPTRAGRGPVTDWSGGGRRRIRQRGAAGPALNCGGAPDCCPVLNNVHTYICVRKTVRRLKRGRAGRISLTCAAVVESARRESRTHHWWARRAQSTRRSAFNECVFLSAEEPSVQELVQIVFLTKGGPNEREETWGESSNGHEITPPTEGYSAFRGKLNA